MGFPVNFNTQENPVQKTTSPTVQWLPYMKSERKSYSDRAYRWIPIKGELPSRIKKTEKVFLGLWTQKIEEQGVIQ